MVNILGDRTRWLLRHGKKYRNYWLALALLFVPTLLVATVRPFLVRYLIDNVIATRRFDVLGLFLLGLVGTVVVERLLGYEVNVYHACTNHRVVANEQRLLYERVQNARPAWLARLPVGDTMTRILQDTNEIGPAMATTVPALLFNGAHLAVILGVLFYLSWKLALIVVATIPVYYLAINGFSGRLQSEMGKERAFLSALTDSLREKLEGMLTIKTLQKQEFFATRFAADTRRWADQAIRSMRIYVATQNLTTFITYVTPVVALACGGLFVMRGEMTLGTLIAFFSYMAWVYEPVQIMNGALIELRRLEPVADRFFEIYHAPGEQGGHPATVPAGWAVEYDAVHFRYDGEPVLAGVSLRIGEGEKVAIVGASGSGKTTLASLLPRFYDPCKGTVRVGGVDVTALDLRQLRKAIVLVRGTEPLFTMTVRENIVLGEDVSEEEFDRAVTVARVDKFIHDLPHGYETLVEKGGSNLSDGQRQRIAIARAVLRKPRVLILDEATAGVDAETEEEIFAGLRRLEATLLVISHRLSTIMKADRVVVLDGARVVATGKHDELLSSCPLYRDIVSHQLVPTE